MHIQGPVVSALNNQYGTRPVVMVSSIVYGFCYVLSAFATSIYQIIFLLGLIGGFDLNSYNESYFLCLKVELFEGFAFGCAYLSCFIILVAYFNENLGLANGIAMAGSGMGAFAMAPIVEYFVREFEWNITMIFIGAVTLQCAVLGALLKPLEEKNAMVEHVKHTNESLSTLISNDKVLLEKTKPTFVENLRKMLNEIFDLRILREHKSFKFFCVANSLFCLVYFVPFIFIPVRAEQLKIENYSWLISIIGNQRFSMYFFARIQ
jgi:MFS family permease